MGIPKMLENCIGTSSGSVAAYATWSTGTYGSSGTDTHTFESQTGAGTLMTVDSQPKEELPDRSYSNEDDSEEGETGPGTPPPVDRKARASQKANLPPLDTNVGMPGQGGLVMTAP